MNIRNLTFIAILLLPSIIVFIINSAAKTNQIDTLSSANDLLGITLLPFIAGLVFKTKESYILATSSPIIFISTKSLFFDGAERIVFLGFVVFLVVSIISCSLAVAGKYIYKKHLTRHSNGTPQSGAP